MMISLRLMPYAAAVSMIFPAMATLPSAVLKRKVYDRLQPRDCLDKHSRFVNSRHSHVYVQNLSAGVLLGNAFAENIGYLVVFQRFLEALFAGGIDAFADDKRFCADSYRVRIGRHKGNAFIASRTRRNVAAELYHPAYVSGSGSAAAAHHAESELRSLSHGSGEGFRIHVEPCRAVLLLRKTRVGVEYQREG